MLLMHTKNSSLVSKQADDWCYRINYNAYSHDILLASCCDCNNVADYHRNSQAFQMPFNNRTVQNICLVLSDILMLIWKYSFDQE